MVFIMEQLDENATVISAAKVTGTAVFNTESEQLGEIHDVMLDKRSGKIAMQCCRSVVFSGSARAIIHCHGRSSNTIPVKAATWSA